VTARPPSGGWPACVRFADPPPSLRTAQDGSLNSLKTRDLAFFTKLCVARCIPLNRSGADTNLVLPSFLSFVFINIGFTFLIIILLLALTPREEMNSAAYVFTSTINDTGYKSDGLAFLFGLLSVQWTMTDYDGEPAQQPRLGG
jgi:hypothetical protein